MIIYESSRNEHDGVELFLAKDGAGKCLYAVGLGDASDMLQGESVGALLGREAKRCPISNANAGVIRSLFPFARPVSCRKRRCTIGLGDRLGLASPGHLRTLKGSGIFPVLAQQSMRELNLTHRTYEDVLSAAVWAVFQEGYKDGYGADGDHLKSQDEVKMALDAGFSMITLDCSEHMPNGLEAVAAFVTELYDELLREAEVDFELSIDETQTVTTPRDHRFIAEAMRKAGVHPASIAPRFPGEFQKGIDYRGDTAEFEKELIKHAQIAEEFGHKLSIHSGSDKFSVYPAIYKATGMRVHIKTAGTHWLEALRTVACCNPDLFRQMLPCALEHLEDAKKLYHITEDTANIPDIETLDASELAALLDNDDARQVLHITYGYVLDAFKEQIFEVLNDNEDAYFDALEQHLRKHLPAEIG